MQSLQPDGPGNTNSTFRRFSDPQISRFVSSMRGSLCEIGVERLREFGSDHQNVVAAAAEKGEAKPQKDIKHNAVAWCKLGRRENETEIYTA